MALKPKQYLVRYLFPVIGLSIVLWTFYRVRNPPAVYVVSLGKLTAKQVASMNPSWLALKKDLDALGANPNLGVARVDWVEGGDPSISRWVSVMPSSDLILFGNEAGLNYFSFTALPLEDARLAVDRASAKESVYAVLVKAGATESIQ